MTSYDVKEPYRYNPTDAQPKNNVIMTPKRRFGVIMTLLSGEPDYFGRNKISSGADLSHYSSASLY